MEKNKKVAYVTGGGQGIGAAICKRLSQDGYAIAVADLNLENAESVATEINNMGGKAVALKVNVADRDEVFKSIDKTVELLGDFNVIVNNAGVANRSPIEEITAKSFEFMFNINVAGVLWGMQAAALKMKELGHGGRIISASSRAGIEANGGACLYGASKFAVRGLTQSFAKDLAPYDILVSCYAPGIVETPMMLDVAHKTAVEHNETDEWGMKQFVTGVAQGRAAKPEEIAAAVSFLAGPDSSIFVGQTLVVDGGMVFH